MVISNLILQGMADGIEKMLGKNSLEFERVVIKVFIIIKAHPVYLIYLIDCGSVELNAIKTHSFCNSTGDTNMRKGRCTISVSLL